MHKSHCSCFKGCVSCCGLWPSCKSWLLRFSFAPLDSDGVKRRWGIWPWKETLVTKSCFNLRPSWDLWCKWVTVKPQLGWKSFLFSKITLSSQGWEYAVKSLQVIYFGPAKVLLGAGDKYAGALLSYRTHPLDRGSILLIALKGKWDTRRINWSAHRWTESLQLYQELKPTPDWIF